MEVMSERFDDAFSRLRDIWRMNIDWNPSDNEWRLLREFASYQKVRHPLALEDIESEEAAHLARLGKVASDVVASWKGSSQAADKLTRFFAHLMYGLDEEHMGMRVTPRNLARLTMYGIFEKFVHALERFNHALIEVEDEQFVTSDDPVSISDMPLVDGTLTELLLVLSPKLAVLFSSFPMPSLLTLRGEGIGILNARVAATAYKGMVAMPIPRFGSREQILGGFPAQPYTLVPTILSAPNDWIMSAPTPNEAAKRFAAANTQEVVNHLSANSGSVAFDEDDEGMTGQLLYESVYPSGRDDGQCAVKALALKGGHLKNVGPPGGNLFTWGYRGGGPLNLALSLLEDVSARAGLAAGSLSGAAHDVLYWFIEPTMQSARFRVRGQDLLRFLAVRHAELYSKVRVADKTRK